MNSKTHFIENKQPQGPIFGSVGVNLAKESFQIDPGSGLCDKQMVANTGYTRMSNKTIPIKNPRIRMNTLEVLGFYFNLFSVE